MKPQSVTLREQTVLERTKAESLSAVRNLNLWGEGFTDVTIVERIPGIEVLALAANQLTTLRPFASCTSLRELYLRKNDIKSLAEVKYIKDLPNLRTLWLMDNPCAKSNHYRSFVLRCCPNLKQLDNIEVTETEREEAKKKLSEEDVKHILEHGTVAEADLSNKRQQTNSSAVSKAVEKGSLASVGRQPSQYGRTKEKEKELRQDGNWANDAPRESSCTPTSNGVPYTTVKTQQAIITAIVSLIPELTLGSLGVLQKEIKDEVVRKEKSVRNRSNCPQ
ncbi:putative C21orf2-like protein [Trypanosoma cruzi]|nr:putative C21orf2-like protein [Trypanosoma cruzi]